MSHASTPYCDHRQYLLRPEDKCGLCASLQELRTLRTCFQCGAPATVMAFAGRCTCWAFLKKPACQRCDDAIGKSLEGIAFA